MEDQKKLPTEIFILSFLISSQEQQLYKIFELISHVVVTKDLEYSGGKVITTNTMTFTGTGALLVEGI